MASRRLRLTAPAIALCFALFAGELAALPRPAGAAAPVKGAVVAPLTSEAPAAPDGVMPTGDFSEAPPRRGKGPEELAPALDRAGVPGSSKLVGRDERTDFYANSDGTTTAVVRVHAVNFREAGSGGWKPIDTRLVERDGGLGNAAGPVKLKLAKTTGDQPVVLASGPGWSLGYTLSGAAKGTVAQVEGSVARYLDVVPGVDLEERVTTSGVRETIVLNRPLPARAPASFRFPLSLTGLTPQPEDSGAVAFVDAAGAVVARLRPGWAVDSAGDPAQASMGYTPVAVKAVEAGAGWAVEVSVSEAWLRDPARAYPIRIDPDIDFYAGTNPLSHTWDTFVSSKAGEQGFNFNTWADADGPVMFAGLAAPGQEYYSYLKYDLTPLHAGGGHVVQSAYWSGHFYSASTYSGAPFAIWKAAGPWTDSTLTWNGQPGHTCCDGPAQGTVTGANQRVERNITGWAQGWVDNPASNHGITIDTMGAGNLYRFAASENGDPARQSFLRVTVSNEQPTWPAVAQLTPAHQSATMAPDSVRLSTVPMSDANGDTVWYWFRAGTDKDAEYGQTVNSGWTTSPFFDVPPATFQDGVTYYWKVFTWDRLPGSTPVNSSWPPATLKVDHRLGNQPSSPMETVGPVAVNLANGNVTMSLASPSLQTAVGPIGVSYTYNSLTSSGTGLEGGLTGA